MAEALNIYRAEARRKLVNHLREHPDDPDSWRALAGLVDRREDVIRCLKQVARLRPGDVNTRHSLDHLLRRNARRAISLPRTTSGTISRPQRRSLWRALNFPLVIGAILTAALVAVGIIGPSVSPFDPMERHSVFKVETGEFFTAPFAPGELEQFPLGSDFDGRDALSRLLWAVRPTLMLALTVALARLAFGTMLGLLEGWYYENLLGRAISTVVQGSITIPVLITAIIILQFVELQQAFIWPFVIALTANGWANVAQLISERVREMRHEVYVEAARALGGSDFHILWRHVIPQVRALLPVLFSFEVGAALLQIAELGFLGFYLGGGAIRLVPDPRSPGFVAVATAGLPELGQMLSAGWENFFLTPWMAMWSGTAFSIAIFSFVILGEGLKQLATPRRHSAGQSPS
jgi:ABC-type dipeptide/oligopeptide/nickel transport system permease subunit